MFVVITQFQNLCFKQAPAAFGGSGDVRTAEVPLPLQLDRLLPRQRLRGVLVPPAGGMIFIPKYVLKDYNKTKEIATPMAARLQIFSRTTAMNMKVRRVLLSLLEPFSAVFYLSEFKIF